MLGLNQADDKEIAKIYMEENGFTFPNILDASPASWEVINKYETLGMTAVPLTYLIDREGKVVEAWYGYQEGRAEMAIEKMGLDG